MRGERVKRQWEPMQLQYIGRVGDVMRGNNGTNFDPGNNNHTKLGAGGPTG